MDKQIEELKAAIEGEGFTNASYQTLAALSKALTDLEELVGDSSVAGQIATAIGQPSVGETAATGLWAQIEALASQVVADLEGQISDLGDAITGGDLTESTYTTLLSISNALETLNGAGDSSVAGQIATAIGQPSVGETAATGLWAQIEALASELVTYVDGQITDLEQKIQGEGVAEGDFTTLADLASAIGSLGDTSTTSTTDIAALKTAVGVADDGEGNATGLYLLIETSIQTAVDALEAQITANDGDIAALINDADANEGTPTTNSLAGLKAAIDALSTATGTDISALETAVGTPNTAAPGETSTATGLYLLIETSLATAITDLEQKILGDTFNSAEDYATLEALSDAIDALQISSGANLSDLEARVGEPATTDTPASGLYAEIAKLQDSIDAINAVLQPAEIQGNELDNFIQMYPYSTQTQTIRVEAGAGDDRIDGANVNSQVVGGEGADVINLTYLDQSQDSVVYQDVSDGRALNAVKVSFSTAALDYRESSVLTLTINGSEYSYTVRTDGGTSMADALSGFADSLRADLFAPDPTTTVVGLLWSLDDLYANVAGAPSVVTLADLGEDGTYQVPAGMLMIPISNYEADGLDLAVFGAALSGGATFTATTEQIYDLSDSSFGSPVFASEAWVEGYLAGFETSLTPADLLMATSDVVSAVTVAEDSLVIFGLPGETVTVEAGGDTDAAIENAGMATQYAVTFSSTATDWPTPTNDGNTTVFDRSLSVTINNGTKDVVVTADVAFVNGVADQAASISNLATAVNVHADLDGVVTASASGNTLTLTADVIAGTDTDAPTFTVASASVEKNGVQQETLVNFSNDPTDYYEGGTLTLTLAGMTDPITADMVAGDAIASVRALRDEITNQSLSALESVELGTQKISISASVTTFQLADGAVLTGSTLLNAAATHARYRVDISIDDKRYDVDVWGNDTTSATTIEELVGELNTFFAGYGTFSFDDATDSIVLVSPQSSLVKWGSLSSADGIYLYIDGGLEDPGILYADATTKVGETTIAIEEDAPSLILTAATEAPDPLQVSATLGYEGEYQQATLSLEDAANYTAFTDGTDLTDTNRGADVYYEGGKVYLTITGFGADKALGGGDDVVHTINADMGVDSTATLNNLVQAINAETSGTGKLVGIIAANGASASAGTITLAAANPGKETFNVTDVTLDYQGVKQLATFSLETATQYDEYVDSTDLGASGRGAQIYFTDGKAYLTIIEADPALVGEGTVTDSVTISALMGEDAASTSANLVSAINGEIAATGSIVSQLLESATYDATSGDITLTAKNPGKETFEVTSATLDYQGVKQIATISLEDTLTYTAYSYGTSTTRGAEVYYEGGKVYTTITGAGADGVLGTDDDTTSVVSADMVPTTGGVVAASYGGLTADYVFAGDATTNSYFKVALLEADGSTKAEEFITQEGETTESFLARVESTSAYISSASFDAATGDITVLLKAGASETVSYIALSAFNEEPFIEFVNSNQPVTHFDGFEPTSQALVDAINAKIDGSAADPDLSNLLDGATYDAATGEITLTGKDTATQTFTVSDVKLDYQGVQQMAQAAFSTDDADYYTGGDLRIGVTPVGGTEIVISAYMVDGNAAQSIQNLVDAINDKIFTTGELGGVLSSVTHEDGIITLTSADNVKEQFTLSSAEIDYAGVKQVAQLDYSVTAGDFFTNGKLYATVNDVEYSATMVAGNPAASVAALAEEIATAYLGTPAQVSLTLVGTVEETTEIGDATLMFSVNGTDTALSGSFGTVSGLLTAIEGLAGIASAELVDGAIVVTTEARGADSSLDVDGTLTNTADEPLLDGSPVSDPGTDATLTGIGSVVASGSTITLTADTPQDGNAAFTVANIKTDVDAVKQVTEVLLDGLVDKTGYNDFTDTDTSPHVFAVDDAGNTGEISIQVAGVTVTAQMADTVEGTAQNLADRIENLRDGVAGQEESFATELLVLFTDGDSYTIGGSSTSGDNDQVNLSISLNGVEVFNHIEDINSTQPTYWDQPISVLIADINAIEGISAAWHTNDNEQSGIKVTADANTDTLTFGPSEGTSSTWISFSGVGYGYSSPITVTGTAPVETVTQDLDIAAAVGDVVVNETSITITAKEGGVDPLEVSGFILDTPYVDGTTHEVTLQFANTYLDGPDILGETLSVTLNGVTSTLTVDATLLSENTGDQSEFLVGKLLEQVIADHTALTSPSTLDLTAAATAQAGNVLRFVANVEGPGSLNIVTASVTQGDSTAINPTAVILETIDPGFDPVQAGTSTEGATIYDADGEGSVAVTGVDGFTASTSDTGFSAGDYGLTLDETATDGDADDPIIGTTTNPSDDASFYGDAPQLVEDQTGTLTGDGVRQSFTNPDSEYTATSGFAQTGDIDTTGGDATYYGDAALFGEDDSGTLTREGVLQSFTNPDSEYTATSGSPASGTVDTREGAGDSTFSGDDERLGTDGVDQTFTNPSSGYDALPASPEYNTASGNTGDTNLEGIAAGAYDENDVLTYEDGSPTAAGDKIDLGDGSTTGDGGVAGEAETSITDTTSDTDTFDASQLETGFAAYEWDSSQSTTLADTSTGFDVVNNFQVDVDVIVIEGGLAESTGSSGGEIEAIEAGNSKLRVLLGSGFDLSENEFGLVSSASNFNVDAADIENADAVAELLNNVFNFEEVRDGEWVLIPGTTDNGEINTSIFAVTASDDETVTAIWAHTQSSSDDGTVEDYELNLLATVNTTGGEFGSDNFALFDGTELRQPEILQSQLIG